MYKQAFKSWGKYNIKKYFSSSFSIIDFCQWEFNHTNMTNIIHIFISKNLNNRNLKRYAQKFNF